MCKITAPEPEPQRGEVIQTDNKGRIATTPIGTPDRPVSRIITRDEFRDMQDTSQGRSFEQAQEDLSPEQKMLALSRQPTTPVGIRSFGPPSARANINIMPSNKNLVGGQAELKNREEYIIAPSLFNLHNRGTNKNLLSDQVENIMSMQTMPKTFGGEFSPEMMIGGKNISSLVPIVPEFDQDNEGDDPNDILQKYRESVVSDLGEGRLGGNMVGTASQVPEFTTARSQVGQPNIGVTDSGIRSLNERGRDLQKGFEAAYGVDVPNDPYKAMQARINDPQYQDFLKAQDSIFAGAANRLGKFMGYDDPFELYKATQAQKERSKVADAMRRRDQDRAMQSQAKQPFDPCPPGYKYDPAQRQCVPVAKEEAETEMGQKFVRNPVAFTGDPNMYGRTGGEYQFFTEVPGLIKAANGIPRGPTGEIRGVGGPKDDLVGPFMLSDQEYVLPKEMVMAAGGGNYDTGIKKLENMRKDSLNKYGDYV